MFDVVKAIKGEELKTSNDLTVSDVALFTNLPNINQNVNHVFNEHFDLYKFDRKPYLCFIADIAMELNHMYACELSIKQYDLGKVVNILFKTLWHLSDELIMNVFKEKYSHKSNNFPAEEINDYFINHVMEDSYVSDIVNDIEEIMDNVPNNAPVSTPNNAPKRITIAFNLCEGDTYEHIRFLLERLYNKNANVELIDEE